MARREPNIFLLAFGMVTGILVATLLLLATMIDSKPPSDGQVRKIKVDQAPLTVTVAASDASRTIGLMGSRQLDDQHGMLFHYPQPAVQTIWMKNVSYPIDIIWVRDGTVTEITANVPPAPAGATDETLPRYFSSAPVNQVIEVRAGWAAAHSIQPGDLVRL